MLVSGILEITGRKYFFFFAFILERQRECGPLGRFVLMLLLRFTLSQAQTGKRQWDVKHFDEFFEFRLNCD